MAQSEPTAPLLARESGGKVVIYDPDNDDAWIRSNEHERPEWRR